MLVTSLSSIAIFSGLSAGYLIFKNLLTNEEAEEVIETNNIIKYEYYPIENINLETKEENIIKYIFIEGEKEGIKACIGQDLEGNNISIDLFEGHAVVGGASRWGKSNFLNVFITNIIRTYTKNEVCFIGCDYKKSDVYYFRKYKNFIGMSENKEEFLSQLDYLELRMKERSEILEKANCRNVIKYNKTHDKKMSYIIFVIDELIQVVVDKKCRERLHTIMSKCASYGIYFLLASQDLTKETIGRCKMNCSQTIGFHTFDETDSNTLIGKGQDLQNITIKGRCKIKNSEGVTEVQTFYIDEDQIEEILEPYEK